MSQSEHPKEEPVWEVSACGDNWAYQTPQQTYGVVSGGVLRFMAWANLAGEGPILNGPCDSIEDGKRRVEEQVAQWRAEGVLV